PAAGRIKVEARPGGGTLSNAVADLHNGMHAGQIDPFEISEYGTPRMNVVVHQAGNDRMAAQIRQLRLRAGESAHCGSRSHRDNGVAADCERLLDAEGAVYRNDFPV